MATYVTAIRLTDQGRKDIKSTCNRAEQFREMASEIGVQITGLYWTTGALDGLVIFDAADDETATAAMLRLGASGNVHTETSRAYNAAEIESVLNKIP